MNLDDQLYDIVAKEIRSGTLVDGLYARAFAEANGDKDKAQAKYIKLRVAQLRQEVKDRAEQQQAKAQAEARRQKVEAKSERTPMQTDWALWIILSLAIAIFFVLLSAGNEL